MKTKDFLIVALFPLCVLAIPLVAMQFTREVNWTASDFAVMWVVLSIPTFLFRLLVTRQGISLSYKLGAAVGIVAGFLMTWVNLAVQIIGDDNPAFVLYILAALVGLAGVALSRFQPAALAKAAYATAAAVFVIPIIAVICWPSDFDPGVLPVFVGNTVLSLTFVVSGLLFNHAAGRGIQTTGARTA
jgi:hypothetical protein